MHLFEPPIVTVPDKPETGQQETALGNQAFRQDLSRLRPESNEKLWQPYDLSTALAGRYTTFHCESGIPEFWFISLQPTSGQVARVFDGPEQGGYPAAILGGGGYAKIPGHSEYLTIYNAGLSPLVGSLLAIRGFSLEISPGNVASSGGGGAGGLTTPAGRLEVANSTGTGGDGTSGAPGYVSTASDISTYLGVIPLQYNGATAERVRVANIFKMFNARFLSAGTPGAIWTPATGKKFRLMGYSICTGALASLQLSDGATPIVEVGVANSYGAYPAGNLGNGILSTTANNPLNATSNADSTFYGMLWGVEE